jgi:hypothetical protein
MGLWRRRKSISDARLIEAAGILAGTLHLECEEQVAALQRDGFDEGEAWRLATLLPIAFGRPVLETLGVRRFAKAVTARDADGALVTADLTRQPEYAVGLRLARRHRRQGVMDHDVYTRIAGSSAEIDAVSKALNAGVDIRGATSASSLIGAEVARHLVR